MDLYFVKNRGVVLIFLISLSCLSGCAGSIRSDAVRQLVEKETIGLGRVNQGLKAQEEQIRLAVEDLKQNQQKYLNVMRLWEKELKRSQIFAASPGDLQNKLVRQAVFIQFSQLEIDRNDAYGNLQQDFALQADSLYNAYKKIVAAAAKTEDQLKIIDSYVHESNATFAIESIDMTTIREALSEFDEGKAYLQKAADAGKALEKALGQAKVADRNVHMQELMGTLTLISSRLQELKKTETAKK